MDENQQQGAPGQVPDATPTPSGTGGAADTQTAPNPNPAPVADTGEVDLSTLPPAVQKYIDGLRKENAGHRKTAREAEKVAQTTREKALAEQQQWQQLAEERGRRLAELEPIADQHEQIKAAFNANLEARLKQIPEDKRKRLVDPIRTTMTPTQFATWLDTNWTDLTARQAPGLDGGAGGKGVGGAKTPEQDIRQRFNLPKRG